MKNNKLVWRICVTAVILIVILTFSPLITGDGKIYPFLFGMPYTLWTGIILAIILVFITLIAGNALPDKEEDAK